MLASTFQSTPNFTKQTSKATVFYGTVPEEASLRIDREPNLDGNKCVSPFSSRILLGN
jgi:hypothetical protein